MDIVQFFRLHQRLAPPSFFPFMPLRFNSLRRFRRRCFVYTSSEMNSAPWPHDFSQNFFAIWINRCHLHQVNNPSSLVRYEAIFSPGRPEFRRPLADQLTLQRPPLLIGQIGDSDLEHGSLLTTCQKPPISEVRCNHNLLRFSTVWSLRRRLKLHQ
jgi:hypothetical protein